MKHIKIVSSNTEIVNDKCKITYSIEINDEKGKNLRQLFYEFDKKFEKYTCPELIDPVVVQLFSHAVRGGYDFESDMPIGERLYFQLTNELIPQITICSRDIKSIKIIAPTKKSEFCPTEVGLGMSLGADSLSSYFELTSDDTLDNYKITLFTFFENGAHHLGDSRKSSKEQRSKLFEAQCERARQFAEQENKMFLAVRSNLTDFLNEYLFWDRFEHTHTYRNNGTIMLFQKLIKIYYYAPAFNADEFKCDIHKSAAYYEKMLLPILETDSTRFYNSNGSKIRLEKLEEISKHPEAYDNLLVCYMQGTNCGKCKKCRQTMLELDVLGKLDLFKNSFNIENYKKDKNSIINYVYGTRDKHENFNELIERMEKQGYKPSLVNKNGMIVKTIRKMVKK